MSDLSIQVHSVSLKDYSNDYTQRLETGKFVETVRVDTKAGVYKKWETTYYALPAMPMTHIL